MSILRARVLVVGSQGCGKSALVQTSHSGKYPQSYSMTLPADYCVKSIDKLDMDTTVELHLIDISGADVMSPLIKPLMAEGDLIILCFDVTDRKSYTEAFEWLERIPDHFSGVLVGCKSDLPHLINQEEVQHLSNETEFPFFPTSSLNGDVEGPFTHLANFWIQKFNTRAEQLH
ncbi:hypothetical protein PCE1_002501 [Barthelona sp. PCE]